MNNMTDRYVYCKITFEHPATNNIVTVVGAVKKEEISSYGDSPNNFISVCNKFEKNGYARQNSSDLILARSEDVIILNKCDIRSITVLKRSYEVDLAMIKKRSHCSDYLSTES